MGHTTAVTVLAAVDVSVEDVGAEAPLVGRMGGTSVAPGVDDREGEVEDGDGDGEGEGVDDGEASGEEEESTDRGAATAPATQPAPEATPRAEAGSLTAGGRSLLGAGAGASHERYVEQPAEGRRVRVQEVIPDEGFFVGTSEEDRVYVEFGGDVGETEQRSNTYDAQVGDEVNLTGPVRPAPAEPEQTLNLDPDDARQVKEQGAFINAETVEKAS